MTTIRNKIIFALILTLALFTGCSNNTPVPVAKPENSSQVESTSIPEVFEQEASSEITEDKAKQILHEWESKHPIIEGIISDLESNGLTTIDNEEYFVFALMYRGTQFKSASLAVKRDNGELFAFDVDGEVIDLDQWYQDRQILPRSVEDEEYTISYWIGGKPTFEVVKEGVMQTSSAGYPYIEGMKKSLLAHHSQLPQSTLTYTIPMATKSVQHMTL